MLPGDMVDVNTFDEETVVLPSMVVENALANARYCQITKAALATDSFLSAASFPRNNTCSYRRAIKGKIDPLLGERKRVIIGKLIPAGTDI